MRDMAVVGEQHLQRVPAGRQFQPRLGLAKADSGEQTPDRYWRTHYLKKRAVLTGLPPMAVTYV